MTHTSSETRAEVKLSGRELARQRRQAMATLGKRAVKPQGRTVATAAVTHPAALSPRSAALVKRGGVSTADASGRLIARQRRAAMSREGKAAVSAQPYAPPRPVRDVRGRHGGQETARYSDRKEAGCGCGCKSKEGSSAKQNKPAVSIGQSPREARAIKELSARLAKNAGGSSGRDIALARRKALSIEGKAGLARARQATKIAKYLPDQDWRVALNKGVTGRQIAMQRRKVQALTGKGESQETSPAGVAGNRPTGRRKARALQAPPKVEEGHTLAGQEVTGTLVDRAPRVTGNEPGTCRAVTGTEYVGAEQFESFCSTRPNPHPPKITLSHTLHGRGVTGTSVEPDSEVTGAEYGACREITGSQYLSAEHFQSVCKTRPKPPMSSFGVNKAAEEEKHAGPLVTGERRVTGGESAKDRPITGGAYGRNSSPRPVPEKVAVTHTADGLTITGTAVGHSPRITGDEPGACRAVTGTEYLSAEQFSEICHANPPHPPHKVTVMSSSSGKPVTGTPIGRDPHVTGDEYGACRPITGTPYFNSQDFGDLCRISAPQKVGEEHTQAGMRVSGTEVVPDPKISGDEEGRCALVTGTDYVGAKDLEKVCAESTPGDHPVDKVAVDKTWDGSAVSGTPVWRSPKVTGEEEGSCAPVSGTPYIGQNQYAEFCPAPLAEEQLARVPTHGVVSASEITGDRPGFGGSVVTGAERGACEPVTGTPYVGMDNISPECGLDEVRGGRFLSGRNDSHEESRPEPPRGFSILTPARQAWDRRKQSQITGASLASTRITGSASRAEGLVTGTPEFRHREGGSPLHGEDGQTDRARQRLTGEASPRNASITGDAWSERQRVTGTEGRFSQRNLTQRGHPRGAGRNAHANQGLERPEVPETPITGSAGATHRGATVTVSGGARG